MNGSWDNAFQLFYLAMDSAMDFMRLEVGGIPIWFFNIFVIVVALAIKFIQSWQSRDGDR